MDFINENNLNILQLIFISLFVIFAIFGGLLYAIEPSLPVFIRQAFRYGKFSFKGRQNPIINKLEVSKSWFRHFYIFATIWCLLFLSIELNCIIFKKSAPNFIINFLDFIAGGKKRQIQINSTWSLITIFLMTLQCTRRFYETSFMQVFSSHSKINLSHYIVGYVHYFGVVLALIANTEGFVRGTIPSQLSLSKNTLMQYLCIFIFYFSWSNQYKSNKILASMRKNEQGKVVTEQHFIPTGGFFHMISSPHMFFEIAMYNAILAMIPNCTTWYFVTLWVSTNQIFMGYFTHQWYKQTYKNYPTQRYAILPYIF